MVISKTASKATAIREHIFETTVVAPCRLKRTVLHPVVNIAGNLGSNEQLVYPLIEQFNISIHVRFELPPSIAVSDQKGPTVPTRLILTHLHDAGHGVCTGNRLPNARMGLVVGGGKHRGLLLAFVDRCHGFDHVGLFRISG